MRRFRFMVQQFFSGMLKPVNAASPPLASIDSNTFSHMHTGPATNTTSAMPTMHQRLDRLRTHLDKIGDALYMEIHPMLARIGVNIGPPPVQLALITPHAGKMHASHANLGVGFGNATRGLPRSRFGDRSNS
jgi:hypothetical protein